jgi:hypothetical protein
MTFHARWLAVMATVGVFALGTPEGISAQAATRPAVRDADTQNDKDKNKHKERGKNENKDKEHDREVASTPDQRMRFAGLDRNHDGVVTRREWRGDDRSFDVEDRNNDGVLSGRELRPQTTRHGPSPSRQVARPSQARPRTESDEVLFARRDRNHDGHVSRGEWPFSEDEFRRLDFNHDGVLSPYEYGVGR